MKILLINPPIREWAEPNCFPLGLGYIASVLLQEGHEVEILDINAHRWGKKEVEKRIREISYDLVGIGGIITTYKYVKWLINVLNKCHPEKKIIVGGSVGASIPKTMLERNPVDIVCVGEGEETIRELVNVLQNNGDPSTVKGIWFKGNDGSICRNELREPINDLDKLPFPAWDLFPMDIYLKNPVGAPNRNKWIDGSFAEDTPLSMNLYATRGCPYQCIYCYHDFMGQKYRYRSPDNIISEIKYLYTHYDVKYFNFTDDEFVLKKNFVYQFCQKIKDLQKELSQRITWSCSGRANLMTEELIATMAEADCVLIGYGIESGSQKMLDTMKKKVTVEQAKQSVRLTQQYLGWADCSFMIGTPGETKETIQETIDFCKQLNLIPEVIFFATPYPGTELYRMAIQRGKIKDEEAYVQGLGEQGGKIRVNFTDFGSDELKKIKEDMVIELRAWNKFKHQE